MSNREVKDLAKLGIKTLGTVGAIKIIRNITPYEGVFGSIACGTFAFFAAMAVQDMIDDQMLKCEKILEHLDDNSAVVIV